jgi:hypothetical protein
MNKINADRHDSMGDNTRQSQGKNSYIIVIIQENHGN